MPTINLPLTGTPGQKQMIGLTTTAQDVAVTVPPVSKGTCRFQLIANSAWLYGSANHGATADNWLSVAAGTPVELEVGPGQTVTFWGKHTATAQLHILDV